MIGRRSAKVVDDADSANARADADVGVKGACGHADLGGGCRQMTLGLTFFYAALRRLSPVEVTLIALVEPVLGPLWTWMGLIFWISKLNLVD